MSNYSSSKIKPQHQLLTQKSNNSDNCKVIIRIRPPLPREIDNGKFISTIQVSPDSKKVCIYEYYNLELVETQYLQEYLNNPNSYTMHQFSFDYIYDQDSTQEEVYMNTARQSVISTLQGYNSTIMAYGQTGTGKTFTMEGFKYNNLDPARGIIPRAIEEIFKYIENCSNEQTTFMVRASYLQIYNEVISDLLRTDRTSLPIREGQKRGVYVEGLSEWAVRNPSEIYSLIQKGAQTRATASTKMNDVSSRSHAVFIIIIEQMTVLNDGTVEHQIVDFEEIPKEIKVGKLNLVDLAGSERVRVTGATGKRLEECKKINQSLSCLGNVISSLTEGKSMHIPYRDSKLTRILEDSLGGNCKTTMMAMISPALDAFPESLSSLKFANRAKNIKCQAVINEDVDQRALIKKYELELKKLKSQLQERNKGQYDNIQLSKLEEDRRKAEMDKNMAMAALEERSKEFFQEREQKKMLEDKIKAINSQLLIGGHQIMEHPEFRSALEEQQKIIRSQYEKKLQDLENEREQIEEDKAQVDKYKQLLLKQRDIMIALTSRLNERDETIIQLQEELDAYDRIHRETEEMLENKSYRVEQLERIMTQNNIQIPNIEKKTTQSPAKQQQQSNILETYNITKENLQSVVEEKMQKLNEVNNNQQQEIIKLKQEINQLSSQKPINQSNHNNSNQSFQNQSMQEQQFLQEQINDLTNSLSNYQENQQHLIKELEQEKQRNQELQEESQQIQDSNQEFGFNVKESVDRIIETLSSEPNDPLKLQNVAKDLLNLQRIVQNTINDSQNNSMCSNDQQQQSAFNNISNTFQNRQQQQYQHQNSNQEEQYPQKQLLNQQQQQQQYINQKYENQEQQYYQQQQPESIKSNLSAQNMPFTQNVNMPPKSYNNFNNHFIKNNNNSNKIL